MQDLRRDGTTEKGPRPHERKVHRLEHSIRQDILKHKNGRVSQRVNLEQIQSGEAWEQPTDKIDGTPGGVGACRVAE